VIGYLDRRIDGASSAATVAGLGSVLPTVWSLMLAARARGFGTAWTSIHLMMKEAVAEIVRISGEHEVNFLPPEAND